MTGMEQVRALSVPLPEDILKHKWAGELEAAAAAIDARLERDDIPQAMRARLTCEKERLRRLPLQYPWNQDEAFEKLRELIPDATREEFAEMERAGIVDFIYLHGEKRYFIRFHKSIAKRHEYLARSGGKVSPVSAWLDPMIAEAKAKGYCGRRITVEASIAVEPDAFTPGTYRVWLPIPAPTAQQSRVEILEGQPAFVSPEDAPARTAYWEKRLDAPERFTVTYRYESVIRYADPLHAEAPAAPLYPATAPVCAEDLAEDGTYIRFTPYLRSLAAELSEGQPRPVDKAWAFFRFVTEKVKYAFVRNYFQIDDHGEYCAVNQLGDCGLQALLFISLCRIAGIPARWQSGMAVEPDYTGSHDWAQFYLEGWGWLFADPSYGGGAFRAGNLERQAFYFGNLDPMRMAANRRYMAELEPPMVDLRIDPFDNQSGEVERVGADAPFVGRDVDDTARLVCAEAL